MSELPMTDKIGLETKDRAPENYVLTQVESFTVGPDRYIRDILSCCERYCTWDGCCGAWAPYVSGGGKKINYRMSCKSLQCCFHWTAEYGGKKVGTIQAASCFDNPCATFCPCCFCGDLLAAKFVGPDGNVKFTTRRRVGCCYCINLAFKCCNVCCSPFLRCYTYCCTDDNFVLFEQNIYGPNLNDNTIVAKFRYTERMIHPCCPNQRLQVSIDPNGAESKIKLTMEDYTLLSTYTFLQGSGCEFVDSTWCIQCVIDNPSGFSFIDKDNYINAQWKGKEEALKVMV
mmetsp:Transcript_17909/g.43834  ORF Transcript_17909/g.43834 Transcript_17909/m.43834 type:complete len:286 (+) Transcript_17909:132-989(+)